MEGSPASRAATAQSARLQKTLKDLQTRLKEQEAALGKLRLASSDVPLTPNPNCATHVLQLEVFKTAYEACATMEPYLPPVDSPLPALLTLRTVHQTILDSKISLARCQKDLKDTEQRLEKERSDLQDASLISRHIEQRIETLRYDLRDYSQRAPNRVARDIIQDLKRKTTRLDRETGKMIKSFNAFIDNHLAIMLAAEELGGPVVGDMVDIDELALESGFNSQGKMNKQAAKNDDKRQQRIDVIWAQHPPDAGKRKQPWNEAQAAATEMRDLTEELLNSLVEAEASMGDGDGYLELNKESATARYLVRSKVAQFHPRDARRLRLIDFGRDLDN